MPMRHAAIAVLAMPLLAAPVSAATYIYDFTAELANGRLNDTVSSIVDTAVGFSALTGTLTVTDTVLGSSPSRTDYAAPELTIDQFSLADVAPFTRLSISDAPAGEGTDSIQAARFGALPQDGGVYELVSIIIGDATGNMLANEDLPFPDPVFPLFPNTLFFTASTFGERQGGVGEFALERADFRFTSLTLRDDPPAIPLPASAGLLLAGIGGIAALRRFRAGG